MVIQKAKVKIISVLLATGTTALTPLGLLLFPQVKATNSTFQVNVQEALTVDVVTPNTWASTTPSSSGTFLRNTVGLTVTSNNSTGFTAMMYASNTSLSNTSDSTKTISPLANSTQKSNFPNNAWGYSLDATMTLNNKTYNETNAGYDSSYYHPIVDSTSTPISILTGSGATSGTRNIYFGAKANLATASGTYTDTIILSVITGSVDTGNTGGTTPTTPTNPVTPEDDTNPSGASVVTTGSGPSATSATVYTTVSAATTTTTTRTEVSSGDNRASYANAQGVTTTSKVNEGTPLATGLAVTSAVAAATGVIFFVVAKRREDEEDKDEY